MGSILFRAHQIPLYFRSFNHQQLHIRGRRSSHTYFWNLKQTHGIRWAGLCHSFNHHFLVGSRQNAFFQPLDLSPHFISQPRKHGFLRVPHYRRQPKIFLKAVNFEKPQQSRYLSLYLPLCVFDEVYSSADRTMSHLPRFIRCPEAHSYLFRIYFMALLLHSVTTFRNTMLSSTKRR